MIDPLNRPASVDPSRRRPEPTPGTLYTTARAARPTGTSSSGVFFDIAAARSTSLSGTSLTPKSATAEVACAMPSPDPTGSYETVMPVRAWKALLQAAMSGAGTAAPAPPIVPEPGPLVDT